MQFSIFVVCNCCNIGRVGKMPTCSQFKHVDFTIRLVDVTYTSSVTRENAHETGPTGMEGMCSSIAYEQRRCKHGLASNCTTIFVSNTCAVLVVVLIVYQSATDALGKHDPTKPLVVGAGSCPIPSYLSTHDSVTGSKRCSATRYLTKCRI
jgi:hypothetical protein